MPEHKHTQRKGLRDGERKRISVREGDRGYNDNPSTLVYTNFTCLYSVLTGLWEYHCLC